MRATPSSYIRTSLRIGCCVAVAKLAFFGTYEQMPLSEFDRGLDLYYMLIKALAGTQR